MAKIKNVNKKNVVSNQPLGEYARSGIRHGIAGTEIDEAIPTYESAPSEKIISGKSNSMIVFGRDRPSVRMSGYGGRGGTQCAKIDLVCGLASSMTEDGPPGSDTVVSPNFALDASRIYISQRSDIDAYMGIASTMDRDDSKASSAVGIKADCVRIFGRKNIKIVTGHSKMEGFGPDGELTAAGGINEVPGTITFIAGNSAEPEMKEMFLYGTDPRKQKVPFAVKKINPLVRGDMLRKAIEELMDVMSEHLQYTNQLAQELAFLGTAYAAGQPILPGAPPIPLPPLTTAPVGQKVAGKCTAMIGALPMLDVKMNWFRQNFLTKTSPLYINSKHVFTT
tara:strand:+ start:2519 stop:3529 length:1011 start_codon:yes stop_codon:yes gene_type:complete